MTRKHYELIARAFAGTKPQCADAPYYCDLLAQWEYDVQALATALAFGSSRFIAACKKG